MSSQLKSAQDPTVIDAVEVVNAMSNADEVFGQRCMQEHLIESIDTRLQVSNVDGVTVRITLTDGACLEAEVFALTRSDIVVRLDANQPMPEAQAIAFELQGDGFVSGQLEGFLHWTGDNNGNRLCGVFAAEAIPRQIFEMTKGDRRTEVRYPIELKAIVRGKRYREEGRVIDYSLNGIGIVVDKPFELDERYEATIMVDGQLLKLPALCRFNTRSEQGYVAGCGLRSLEGSLLVCGAFRSVETGRRPIYSSVSRGFPALNLISGRGESLEFQAAEQPRSYDRFVQWFNCASESIDERLNDRPVISRAAIPILASVLIGMSIKATGRVQIITALYAMFGMLAYVGLTHAANIHQRRREDEAVRIKRELAERRLVSSRSADLEAV